jgi:serine/threonine-protein kinase
VAADLRILLPLAESVADGSSVDWDAVLSGASEQEQVVIRQLRTLADLARLHRSLPPEMPEQPLSRADGPSAIGNWAHLMLMERLGEGAFGEVYRAWDSQLERDVALKLLRAESSEDPRASRIAREGRLLARIHHTNVVTVYGVAVNNRRVGLWMELIRGDTLEQRLLKQGPFSAEEASLAGIDVCAALAAVHGAGLIHRDVKSQNVMREDGGRMVLMDLGTGREIDASRSYLPDLVGTPLYLAPEIFSGVPASVRSDLYSLGVLLYHLVTGSYPVRATTIEELQARLAHRKTVRLRDARADLPTAFVRVVERAIAVDPAQRYESAGALEADLLHALDDVPMRQAPEATETPSRSSGGRSDARTDRAPSIAVIPFVDMNREKNLEYFCDGISEEIINALTKVRGLRVAARTSAFQFKGKAEDLRRVGATLNVGTILEGSVRATGNRLRIIAQLIDATSGYHLWSERFERNLEDVFVVQDEIAAAVARTLRVRLTAGTLTASSSTTNFEAYTLFLKGRHHWNKRTENGLMKSVAYFQQALDRDPGYAQAYVGLAEAHVTLGTYGALPPNEVMPRARAMAQEAMKLVDSSPEVFTSLGCIGALYDWAWPEAEQHFRRAIDLNPQYPTARQWYAINLLVPQQRFVEAAAQLKIAAELDPLSLAIGTSEGLTAYFARHYRDAVNELGRTLELDADFAIARLFLGHAYTELSKHDEAIHALETVTRLSTKSPEMVAGLGYACGRAGHVDRARTALGELAAMAATRYVSSSLHAQIYAGLGDTPAAVQWLERAHAERATDLAWLGVRPVFDGLRSDAQFLQLCEKIGIQQQIA